MRSDRNKAVKSNAPGGRAVSAAAIVCYVLSVIMLAAAVFMLYYGINSVTQYVEAYGMSVSDVMTDVIQSVAGSFLPYLAYAAILFGIGRVISMIKKANSQLKPISPAASGYAGNAAVSENSAAKETVNNGSSEDTESAADKTEKDSNEGDSADSAAENE